MTLTVREPMMTNQTTEFNPWKGIRDISSNAYYASRSVDELLNPQQRDLHWSLNETGNPALLIGYGVRERCTDPMPRFKGITTGEDRSRHLIVIALQDSAMREAFLKVCLDIIAVLQTIPEDGQRHAVILRLERWAYFFRGVKKGLTDEEQKGLIAELTCFKNVALRILGSKAALQSWVGPQRSPHDFVFGQTSIEVKSNRGSGTPSITVSSSSQLSVNDDETLYLYVVEVNQAVSQTEGHTLTDYVHHARESLESPLEALEFDLRLSQVGYDETDDYSNTLWSIGIIRCFAVTQDFPHIKEGLLNPAISHVTYKVNINYCNQFEISENKMLDSLRK